MTLLRNLVPVGIALAVLYVCLFSGGGALGLIGPDEPRYVAIAREMAETGDWVTPRLQGEAWFEKPVLYYWAAGLSFKMFGESESAARLPSALMATLATLALAWLAYRTTARGALEAAFLTAVILPTTVALVGFGRAATTDMIFSSLLAIALVCAAELVWHPRTGAALMGWHLAWGGVLGFATLAKGPAAVVLAGGGVALWTVVTQRWRDAMRLLNPLSIIMFFVVALPWYVLCALRNPDFVQVFLVSHNFERFVTPVFRHEQPFWFFGPVLLLGLVPWTALVALGASELSEVWRVRRWQESRGFFVLCWVIFPLVFFSISKSKLPGYILPAVLPLVMLAARALARALEDREALAARTLAVVGLTFVALAVTGGFWQQKLPPDAIEKVGDSQILVRWMLTVGLSGAAIAGLAMRRRVWVSLFLCLLVTSGLVLAVLRVGTRLDVDLSSRQTAEQIRRWKPETEKVSVHQLHRAWHYGLNYYLRRSLPEWSEATPRENLLVVSDAGLLDLLGRGYDVRVARRMNKQAILVFAEKSQR